MVGPTYAKRLEKLGIKTIEDLIFHFPFRYDDFSLISPISRLQIGETVTITGILEKITNAYTKNGKKIQKATLADNSGKIEAVWFNQPYLARTIKAGETYNFSGKVDWFGRQKVFISPEYEIIKTLPPTANGSPLTTIHTGRLVPIYNETYGVSSKWLRSRVKIALQIFGDQIAEFLPNEILQKEGLMAEKEAILKIHFPENKGAAEKARYRLAFDELFLIQLAGLLRKKEWEVKTLGKPFSVDQEKILRFMETLPFSLTNAQRRCLKEILSDMQKSHPMNRLLEGDVGSGKTVVAAAGAYVAFLNGQQTLFMAPTEILANQHYSTLKTLLTPLDVPIELVTASHKPNARKNNVAREQRNNENIPKVIVGTHSLLYQEFDSGYVGLVIVDEQHRFGVEQRALLAKKGDCPHFLTMTATPIPRTITLTLFGDLELSVIDEMPLGRLKVKTWVVPKEKRGKAYEWIRDRIKDTPEQAFIICPLIEESETLSTIKAATKEFELLTKVVFPDLRLGLLHGRMKSKEKDQILEEFKKGNLDILVATPVVEVGLDIPNATIMLVEGADRFGLAQLHQLRGRVGRSNRQSYCFLFTENEIHPIVERLKSLERTNVGMELAEIDLKIRGPGEIYGTRQHGFPDLRVASFSNLNLIQRTRQSAIDFLVTNHPACQSLPARLPTPDTGGQARLPSKARQPGALAGRQSLTTGNSLLQAKLEKYKINTVTN